MRAVGLKDPAHTHGWSSFQQGAGDDHVCLRNGVASTSDGQNSIVHTLHHLGDTSFDTSLIAQFSNILAAFADDDASLFGGDDGAQSQLGLGIFFVGAWCRLAIGTQTTLIVELNAIESAGKVVAIGRDVLRGRHGVRLRMRTEGDER